MDKRNDMSEWHDIEIKCAENYHTLLKGVYNSHAIGTAQCPTPIRETDLTRLITRLRELGANPRHEVIIGYDHSARICLYWDGSKQWDGMCAGPTIFITEGSRILEELVYHGKELYKYPIYTPPAASNTS